MSEQPLVKRNTGEVELKSVRQIEGELQYITSRLDPFILSQQSLYKFADGEYLGMPCLFFPFLADRINSIGSHAK